MSPPCEQGCSNTMGSYQCTCGVGYTLNDDGRSCTGISLMQACIQGFLVGLGELPTLKIY